MESIIQKLKTERLILRPMTMNDRKDLAEILQDPAVMVHYEKDYTDQDVDDWLNNQLKRYQTNGLGLLAVIEKSSGQMIGQSGLTMQNVEDSEVLEIGYLFKKRYWHHGYATEAAQALKRFAFKQMKAPAVYCTIKTTNYPSQAVARRLGMTIEKEYIKHFNGKEMPHYLFSIKAD